VQQRTDAFGAAPYVETTAIAVASSEMTQASTNLLLSALSPKLLRKLLVEREPVRLALSTGLVEHGEQSRHVYFPVDSFVSLLTAPSDGSAPLEVALVGNEGMVGTWLLLGVEVAPLRALVQGSGLAWRVDAKTFRREIAASPVLRDAFGRYLYVQLVQLAQTAACTRFHVVESRLARWLLMTRDRAHSRKFHITQQFLAYMLGVRRAGVTRAATSLRRRKLIRYSRGDIEITDERGLEKAACGCYATDKETYDRVIGRRSG
jgi:CRP-like cAMP-binding protein